MSKLSKSERQKKLKTPAQYSVSGNVIYLLRQAWSADRWYFPIVLLHSIVAVLLPLVSSLLPKFLIDGLSASSFSYYFSLVAAAIAALFLLNVLQAFLHKEGRLRADAQRFRYIGKTMEKFSQLDYEFLISKRGTEMVYRALNQAQNGESIVGTLFQLNLVRFGSALLAIIVFSSLIFQVHYSLLIIVAIASLMQVLYGRYSGIHHQRELLETQEDRRKSSYLLKKTLEARFAKDLKVYRIHEIFPILYRQIEARLRAWSWRSLRLDFWGQLMALAFAALRDYLSYFYLIYLFLAKQIGLGEFVFMLGIIRSFASLTESFFSALNEFQKSAPEISEVREFLELDDGLLRRSLVPLPTRYDIVFENVSFRYNGEGPLVLRNLNLTIRDGESMALVGLNGAGKTTLCSLLIGLLQPDEGRILVGGVDLAELSLPDRYRLFSVVFQESLAIPVSVEQFVTASREVEEPERVAEALRQAELLSKIESLPHGQEQLMLKVYSGDGVEFSGGETQRLCLARALYRNAPINILDEPTAALDALSERNIYEHYFSMMRGRTSLFISHRLASTRFCDRVCLIQDGEILELGSHEELMARGGEYRRLYDIQAHYYRDGEDEAVASSEKSEEETDEEN